MKEIVCKQNSPEWIAARCGIPSASSFHQIITKEGKPSKQRDQYLYQLAGERITGMPEESYQSVAMLRGKEIESEARQFYEIIKEVEVKEVGFCLADGRFKYGASPDGFVGADGCLEIKSPMMAKSVSYIIDGGLPSLYFCQVQGQLLVTGRKWVDFLSYHKGLRPHIIRVEPHLEFQSKLKLELEKFCIELEDIVNKIK